MGQYMLVDSIFDLKSHHRSASATVHSIGPLDQAGHRWATIDVIVQEGDRSFTKRDAFLTVNEMGLVKDFLSNVHKETRDNILTFIEPSFSILYLIKLHSLVLLLSKELRPDWSISDPYSISFKIAF
jgi:hypothetical protein